MPAVSMSGAWRITVVGKESLFAQRIVISGDVQRMLSGEVGISASVSGGRWILGFEHNRGDGVWRQNASVEAGEIVRYGDEFQRLIVTKDVFWSGDGGHDDLKLLLTRPAPATLAPCAVDARLHELSASWVVPPVETPGVSQERPDPSRVTRPVGTPLRRIVSR